MSRGLRMTVEEYEKRFAQQSKNQKAIERALPSVVEAFCKLGDAVIEGAVKSHKEHATMLAMLDDDSNKLPAPYVLPYPPSVNTYWRNIGPGRTILSKRAREYRKSVLAIVGPAKPLLGRLSVSIILSPPDKRKRDLDNAFKGVLDGLAHACVYRDDEQIDELTIRRGPVVKGGRCEVTIREI